MGYVSALSGPKTYWGRGQVAGPGAWVAGRGVVRTARGPFVRLDFRGFLPGQMLIIF
jgi:hypothetical protein